MKAWQFISGSLLLLGAFASPLLEKRATIDETSILNFALTLEHLEDAFYSGGLSKFSQKDFLHAGFPPWVRGRFVQMAEHEHNHVLFLEKVLGDKATKPCTYKFPYNDTKSFIELAKTFESVGVSAYAGGAQFITDKKALTSAAVILSTEARHATWIRSAVDHGSGWSGSFDVALGLNEVFTLASGSIESCPPSNPPLPVTAFPSLKLSSIKPGSVSTISFTPAKTPLPSQLFVAIFIGLDTIFLPVHDMKITIPSDLVGLAYAVVTSSGSSTADDVVLAGPAIMDIDFDSNGKVL